MENTRETIIDLFRTKHTFAILPHINPDADAIGSCYAVKHVLEAMGKRAAVFVEEALPPYLSFLEGESTVFTQAEPFDVCLCIDCGDLGRTGARSALLDTAQISVNIDHHYANTCFAQVNLVDAGASSSGEICYGLLAQMGAEITPVIASCLYSAICADTGGFRYSNTSAATMRAAAGLLEYGVDIARINKVLFDTESYPVFQLKGEIIRRVELHCGGTVGLVCVDEELLRRYGVDSKEVDNLVDLPRRVEGVEIAVSLKESDKGIKVSLRSNEWADVSKIAERLGGGGHVRAAGILMDMDMAAAKRLLLQEIKKAVGEQTE